MSRACCTLSELKTDYEDLIGDDKIPHTNEAIRDLLVTIPGVTMRKSDVGTEYWQVSSEKAAHITEMVKKQRRRRTKRTRTEAMLQHHEEAAPPKLSRVRKTVTKTKTGDGDRKQRQPGYYYNHQLMGDDFFLCVAKMQLGYGMQRGEPGFNSSLP